MENLADEALKPPFGLASLFFSVVAVLSLLGTGFSLMAATGGSPLQEAANLSAAGSSFGFFCGSIFALAVLKALREILHELRRARSGV